MKNYLLQFIGKISICLFFITSLSSVEAQISQGGVPLSFYKSEIADQEVPTVNMVLQNQDQLLKKAEEEDLGLAPKFGERLSVNLTLNNSGVWYDLDNGDRVWRLKIASKNAKSINLLYNDFSLPKGAHLFLYGKNGKQLIGAFTDLNNKKDRVFATGLIYGDETTLEYFEPSAERGNGAISIGYVVHGFRYINAGEVGSFDKGFNDSGSCQVNVNCPEGNDWQDQKKSVALVIQSGNRFCTAYLINNTAEDCRPLLMGANHCLDPDSDGNYSLNTWSFVWNYESPGCTSVDGSTVQTTIGAVLLANPDSPRTINHADFALFELSESPKDAGYDVYFAGFDALTTPTALVGIHHPKGDVKKIAISNSAPILAQIPGSTATQSHFLLPGWDTGGIAAGSSGSPLFDKNTKRTVGILSQGVGECTPNNFSAYGRLAHAWENGGTTDPSKRINVHLDPVTVGAQKIMDGSYDPCGSNSNSIVTIRKGEDINFAIDGGNGGVNNQNLFVWYYGNNDNQQWVEINRGGGYYTYKKKNTNVCIDGGNGGANGQNVKLYTCSETNQNQHWKKVDVGSGQYRLEKRNAPNYSIDGGVGNWNGQNIYLWSSDNSNTHQHWFFTKVGIDKSNVEGISSQDKSEDESSVLVYPNPSSGSVKIDVELKQDGPISISVYDINGLLVASVVDRTVSSGNHSFNWTGAKELKGMFLVKVRTNRFVKTEKLLIIK